MKKLSFVLLVLWFIVGCSPLSGQESWYQNYDTSDIDFSFNGASFEEAVFLIEEILDVDCQIGYPNPILLFSSLNWDGEQIGGSAAAYYVKDTLLQRRDGTIFDMASGEVVSGQVDSTWGVNFVVSVVVHDVSSLVPEMQNKAFGYTMHDRLIHETTHWCNFPRNLSTTLEEKYATGMGVAFGLAQSGFTYDEYFAYVQPVLLQPNQFYPDMEPNTSLLIVSQQFYDQMASILPIFSLPDP